MLIPIGFFGAKALDPAFLGVITGVERTVQTVSDAAGNIYQLTSPGNFNYLTKMTGLGVVIWQRSYGTTSIGSATGLAVDASNNVYVSSSDYEGLSIYKYNSSGTIQWQRRRALSGLGFGDSTNGLVVDASGNSYILGTYQSYYAIHKYDTNGTYQWEYGYRLNGLSEYMTGIAIDSANNILVTGTSGVDASANTTKLDSNGNVIWQRQRNNRRDDNAITTDSANNVYTIGRERNASNWYITKFNSSGTFQFTTTLSGNNLSKGTGIAVATDGAIYVAGLNDTGVGRVQYAKFNSSGVLQWQRELLHATAALSPRGLVLNPSFSLINGFQSSNAYGSQRGTFAKLSPTGSGAGTVALAGQNFTYQATSMTTGTDTPTIGTQVTSRTTLGGTNSSPTVADNAGSFVVTTALLPI